jgi:hypothetical protein
MHVITIITKNKIPVDFWNKKFKGISASIYKVSSYREALTLEPSIIILDDYFVKPKNFNWLQDQLCHLKSQTFSKIIISLSPTNVMLAEETKDLNTNIFYHHFNQTFIETIKAYTAA